MSTPTRLIGWAPVLCSLLILSGCVTGPRISTDFDPHADFSRYQTWGFYEPISMESSGYTTLQTERVRAGVQREMEQHGYRYTATTPDLRVNFQTLIRDRIRTSPGLYDPYFYGGGPWGWGGRWGGFGRYGYGYGGYGYGFGPPTIDTFVEGTLVIDVVDAARNRLVWTGSAASRLRNNKSPTERAQATESAITEIFATYPLRAGMAQPMPPQQPSTQPATQ